MVKRAAGGREGLPSGGTQGEAGEEDALRSAQAENAEGEPGGSSAACKEGTRDTAVAAGVASAERADDAGTAGVERWACVRRVLGLFRFLSSGRRVKV